MTATLTTTRPATKSQRRVRIGKLVNGVAAVAITDGKGVQCGYYLHEIPVDFGRGFELTKFETEASDEDERTYHVHLDEQLGDSCTCKGHIYKSHCKHADAVQTLVALGKL